MIGSGRETLTNVRKVLMDIQEWSVGPPACLGVVGRHSRMLLRVGRPFRMSGSCREAFPNVLEASQMSGSVPVARPDVREWSERPSRMSESGQEALSDVQEWSAGPNRCPRVVGRPSRKSMSGQEALPMSESGGSPPGCSGDPADIWECPGGPHRCSRVVE